MNFNTFNKYFLLAFILFLVVITSASKAQTVNDIIKDIENEKFKSAEKTAKDLTQKEPNNAAAYFYLGKISLIISNIDQAKQAFEKGSQVDNDNMLNFAGLGAISLAKNDDMGAKKIFEDANSESDYNVDVAANIVDFYLILKRKDLDQAKAILTRARDKGKDNKKSPVVFLKLADIAYVTYDNNNAIQNYQYSIDYDKNNVKGYVGIARIYNRVKQYEQAEENLQNALKIDSTYAITYKELGELYYATKKYDEAVNNFKKYLSLTEPTNDSQLHFASMLFLDKKYADAISMLNGILASNQNNPTLYHILAYSYYSLDNSADGIAAYNKYFAIEKPSEISAYDYTNYAEMLSKSGNDSLAIESLKKAVAIDSTNSEVHLSLANSYFKTKKYANAASEFAKANATTKKQLTLRNHFDWGQSYYYSKQYPLSDSVFKKVTEIKSDLALGYLWRAFANSSQDTSSELGLAKPFYEKFIEIASPTPDKYKSQLVQAYSYLGYFYYLKKDAPEYKTIWRDNYKTNWEKVLVLDPQNEQAKTALENLKALK
jgi:tetratricopeptide (TPR) repeat protein